MQEKGGADKLLVLLVLALFGLGLAALYSAGGEARFWTQLQRGCVGAALMLGIARLPPAAMERAGFALFLFALLALAAVLLFGVKVNNARRWLYVGFYFQPSELMKILLPVGLAFVYARLPSITWAHHLAALAFVGVPVFLTLRQPDFGTAAMIGFAGFAAVFFAGMGARWLAALGVGAVALMPIVWSFVLKPYQQKRILTMLDPYADPLGAGYHTIQSQIAIGSGGVLGQGVFAGHAGAIGLFARAPHRLYFFGLCRGVWLCRLRRLVGAGALHCVAGAVAGGALSRFFWLLRGGEHRLRFFSFFRH